MKDMVPKATGNSRLLRSSIPADTTHDELVSMLRTGTFPFDFAGLNAAGISQQGTPLNKSTLLSDETVQKLGIPGNVADATVNDAFMQLSGGMTRVGDVVISMQKEPLPGWYRCDGSLCTDEALAELLRTSLKYLIAKSSNIYDNTEIFGTVMQANGKYFVACGAASSTSLYYADELVGPWKHLSGSGSTMNFIEYANGLYYYFYFHYYNNDYQFYVYAQPNLDNTTGRQQVYSLSQRQYCRYNPVIRFKGKTYMMFGAYENASRPALFELCLTPTVGLTLVKTIGDNAHASSPWSNVFNWCIATDEAIVCWYYSQTGSALCYSTNTTEWHWVKDMVFDGFAGYAVQQYGLRYSKILNKWLIMGYKTNGSNSSIVSAPLYFRIYMNENIEQLHTAYVDAIFDDVVINSISKPIFVETADECYFIFTARIATETSTPYRQCWLVYDATSQTWQLDINGYSISISSSASERSPEVVSFIDDYIIIPDYLTADTNCLALYDARKHLPTIENGFIKGGT